MKIQAQKFGTFTADFSILEKNTVLDTSYVIVGNLEYNLYEDRTLYSVTFPEKKFWEFQDSILTVKDSLGDCLSTDTVGQISEYSLFKRVLTGNMGDFGLLQAGFTIEDVERADNSVIYQWKAPAQAEFIDKVISKKTDDLLDGVIFVDENGKEFNKTFYEDYVFINNVPVPSKIKSHFTGVETEIFKELSFRNIDIR